jgi:16S rRNA (guanine527-N7)-methyltransferase
MRFSPDRQGKPNGLSRESFRWTWNVPRGTESVMSERRAESIDPAPIRARIHQGLERIFGADGLELAQTEKLTQLVFLLAQWAPRMNLTGHRDPMEITSRLVLDAAALVGALPELGSASDLADLGSGAGFPGLPIAILRPHLRVYLVDSRQNRHHFQREARRQLGLDQVSPLLGRSDAIEVHPCDVVVAQAMAQPDTALAQMQAWARPGGLLVLPASSEASTPAIPDSRSGPERRTYRVPLTSVHRQLWVARLASSESTEQ